MAQIISIISTISPLGFILALVPPILWLLIFVYFEDNENPEPKGMLSKVFIAGVIGAWLFAIASVYIRPTISEITDIHSPFLIFIFASLEEAMKFVSVWIGIKISRFSIREPIDKMVYMVTGAMGFAAMENIILNARAADPIQIMVARFFGAVLIHALVSSMVGFYWANGLTGNGLLAAGALHGLFNIIVLASNPIHGLWFALLISLFIIADFDIIKGKWKTRFKS